jgi:hypothetical protein
MPEFEIETRWWVSGQAQTEDPDVGGPMALVAVSSQTQCGPMRSLGLRRTASPPAPAREGGLGHAPTTYIQTYARAAGVLFMVSVAAGGFGEFIVPSKLVASTATTTASNIASSGWLFNLGFAGYLVEAICDVALTLILYVLLKPVSNNFALLAMLFRVVATATFFGTELFYLASAQIVGGADYLKSFSPDQLASLAFLSMKMFGYGGAMASVFYGVALMVFGFLIFKSEYLPAILGVLLALGGVGFVIRSFALLLVPAYASPALVVLVAPAGLLLTLWLLVKGVDVPLWEKRAAEAR